MAKSLTCAAQVEFVDVVRSETGTVLYPSIHLQNCIFLSVQAPHGLELLTGSSEFTNSKKDVRIRSNSHQQVFAMFGFDAAKGVESIQSDYLA